MADLHPVNVVYTPLDAFFPAKGVNDHPWGNWLTRRGGFSPNGRFRSRLPEAGAIFAGRLTAGGASGGVSRPGKAPFPLLSPRNITPYLLAGVRDKPGSGGG